MSYISAERINDEILIWERDENGRHLLSRKSPYYFYVRDPNGTHRSMYGDKLSRLDFTSSREYNFERSRRRAKGETLFESDIPPEIKYLSEHYYNVPAPKLNVTFHDIEVDYDPEIGHANIENPYAPINSIALVHTWKKKYVVLAVPPSLADREPTDDEWGLGLAPQSFLDQMHDIAELPNDIELEVRLCKDEVELLEYYLEEIQDSDVLCGWNSEFFDHPYIAKRVERLGKQHFRLLSFPHAKMPSYRWVRKFDKEEEIVDFGGRIGADYLELFRKYEMSERPSYKLESIAEEILPTLPKLEYEGSLATLYRRNFPWFVRYNIRDTEILEGLENILGYMELANQMMHLSTGVWKNVVGTLKLAEYAVVNYCHNELGGLIVNDMVHTEAKHRIQGAFVLLPQIGLQEGIGAIDIKSLYPSSIRAINISPEMLMGQFKETTHAVEEISKGSDMVLACEFDDATQVPQKLRGKTHRFKASEWREQFKKMNWAISGYGTVFSQHDQGVIPKILEDWYAMRKKYQKLKATTTDPAKKVYYDKMQYTYKIKLNAFYGALANKFFRFFDLRLGESTTGTGRMILLHQCAKTCELLDGKYMMPDRHETEEVKNKYSGLMETKEHFGYTDKWSVVYGDTDSTYFATHGRTPEECIMIGDLIGTKVNDSFQEYMENTFLCIDGFSDKIQCDREIISDRGIFVDKKMYILHIIDNEGVTSDKMKVMGLRTKKTTLPKEIATTLNAFIERFLKGEDWSVIEKEIVDYKDELENVTDIMRIGLPTGIKKIETYESAYNIDPTTHLPGHVAASVHYNRCLKEYKDHESMKIMTGMKIKIFYLTKPNGRFKSIAIPVDIEQVPEWFLKEYEIDRKAHTKRLVDKALENILGAIGKKPPSKQQLLANELLGF